MQRVVVGPTGWGSEAGNYEEGVRCHVPPAPLVTTTRCVCVCVLRRLSLYLSDTGKENAFDPLVLECGEQKCVCVCRLFVRVSVFVYVCACVYVCVR